jgi:hypothetical protein
VHHVHQHHSDAIDEFDRSPRDDWSDVDNLVIISNHIVIGRAVYDNFAAVYDPPA